MIIYHQMEEMYYEGKMKIISAALAGVMALSLTACGGGSTQETTAAPAADSKAEETTAAAEGSEAATGEGVAKEDLKVGFIFIGDENEGYTAAHYKGSKRNAGSIRIK